MAIIDDAMTNFELEILIEAHREEKRAERNAALRARLARRRSREELLTGLAARPVRLAAEKEGKIPLTKSSATAIIVCNEVTV